MDCSPPGSSVPGDFPGNNNGVGCCALLQVFFPTWIEPCFPALQVDAVLSEPPGEPILFYLSEANYIAYSSGRTQNNVFESYISVLVYQEPLCLTAICLAISRLTFLCTTQTCYWFSSGLKYFVQRTIFFFNFFLWIQQFCWICLGYPAWVDFSVKWYTLSVCSIACFCITRNFWYYLLFVLFHCFCFLQRLDYTCLVYFAYL